MTRTARPTTPIGDLASPEFPLRAATAVATARTEPAALLRQADVDPNCIDPHLVALTRENLPAAAEYDHLAVRLILAAAERRLRRILIVSPGRGDGRTTVALNLAGALAAARRRTIVVDTDLRQPSVARMLGIQPDLGLAEAVDDSLLLDGAAIRVNPYGFDLVGVRDRLERPTEALASPALPALLAAADDAYDFVLIDTPPLGEEAAVELLVRHADAAILVLRPGVTSPAELARAIAPLSEELVFGVVLNRAERR